MPTDAMEFLLTRRSRPPKLLSAPGPDRGRDRAAARRRHRVPDHGKLEPWRFVVLSGAGLARFAAAIRARAAATGDDPGKGALAFEQAPVAVAVVSSPKPSDKIPGIEQTLSAGCAALSLLNAALASGWGAAWLTGWPAYDRGLIEAELGLAPARVGRRLRLLGSCATPPPDRPRPDVAALTTWLEA